MDEHKNKVDENMNTIKSEDTFKDGDAGIMDNKYIDALLLPMKLLFDMTMTRRNSCATNFIVSMGWLSLLSFICVSTITQISIIFVWCSVFIVCVNFLGEALLIPHTVAGMTILAAGSAVPDLVTSIIVIRKCGDASMGICSAITANVYAILVGLGLPWVIKCILNAILIGDASFVMQTDSFLITSIVLLMANFALMMALRITCWQLYDKLAIICILIHATFIIIAVLIEY